MNIQEYISSGILELYVTGAASPEERNEVEKYALEYPEIKAELEVIEDAMNLYATSNSVEPPSYLKDKILSDISSKSNATTASETPIVRSINPQTPNGTTNYFKWAIAASVFLIISLGGNFYLKSRTEAAEQSLSELQKNNSFLNDSLKSAMANYNQVMNDLSILKDPTFKIVPLKGLKPAPDAKAMICWNPTEKKVYIEVDKLPAAPKGMQYQLWAIVDGKPVSEGMLGPGTGLHRMPDVENAQAFAVTLEKLGGSPTPKGEMYVMGTI